MKMPSHALFTVLLVVFVGTGFTTAEPLPQISAAIGATGLRSGLAVTMGCDPQIDQLILTTAPDWLLLSIGGSPAEAENRRKALGDTSGRAVVQPLLYNGIPLYPRAAALLIIDADALGAQPPSGAEILRVLRPHGTVLVKTNGKWISKRGEMPDSIADYPHWLGGPGLAAQVDDKEITEVRTLRWQSGRNGETGQTFIVADGIAVTEKEGHLVGLDAFTGLKLWEREDLEARGHYGLVMDAERVVLPFIPEAKGRNDKEREAEYARLTEEGKLKPIAIDAKTGETLLTYSEAPNLRVPSRRDTADDVSLNLAQGKLIVVVGGEMAVLDARTGKRLWQVKDDGVFLFPSVADGRLVCAIGTETKGSRAHGWSYDSDVETFQSIQAYDLNTGKPLWTWNPPPSEEKERVRLTMLNQNAGSVWLDYDVRKRDWYLVRLDPATGNEIWITKHGELGPTDQFARCFVFENTVLLSRGAHDGYMFDLKTGQPKGGRKGRGGWSVMQGGCHAPRASATSMFHSAVSLSGDEPFQMRWAHTIAGRCHIGAFPAQGMLLAADAGCNCDPFIRGLAAYGSDEPGEILSPVTLTGPGKPAPGGSSDGWRTAFRDANRSAWSEKTLAGSLGQKWTTDLDQGNVSEVLRSQWDLDITADVMGAPAVADGVVVITRPHFHEVVALDPGTGAIRWRVRAAGRVDGSVTLAGGMAIFGSAAGWIEAVSLTDGQLVWKTQVAPGTRFRVRSGQIESSHPFLGTVAVVGNRVYASGGVHTHVDGGIHFVALDLASGKLLDREIYDGLPPLMDVETKAGPHDQLQPSPRFSIETQKRGRTFLNMPGTYPSQEFSLAYQEQQNGPLVLTPEGWLGLGTLAYDPQSSSIKLGGIDLPFVSTGHNGYLHKNEARWPQQVRVGMLSRVDDGDRSDEKAILAGIQARAFAYRGNDIITAFSGTSGNWSGDDKLRIARHQWRDQPLVAYTNERGNTKEEVSANVLWKVDAGKPKWGKELFKPTALAASANRAVVAEENTLYVYDIDTGRELQTFELPASTPVAGIAIADGLVVVTCTDGSVLAFQ